MYEIGLNVTDEFIELEKEANLRLNNNTTEIKRIINQNQRFTEKEIKYLKLELKRLEKRENSIENKIQKIDLTSKTFREKVRHPLRTIWNRLIRLLKG